MDILSFISKDALILIPVLWIIGIVLKKSVHVKNSNIPLVLIGLGIIGAILLLKFSVASVLQGILVGGASVGLHQVKSQYGKAKKGKETGKSDVSNKVA